MEAKAVKRYIPSSPRKMRLLVDLIRNKNVRDGINIMKFSKKSPAKIIEKTILSAYSNLIGKLDTGKLDMSDVIIKEAFVDGGPVLKRMLPAPQGRAYRIRKRSAHLTLVVKNIEEKESEKTQVKKNETKIKDTKSPELETSDNSAENIEPTEKKASESKTKVTKSKGTKAKTEKTKDSKSKETKSKVNKKN